MAFAVFFNFFFFFSTFTCQLIIIHYDHNFPLTEKRYKYLKRTKEEEKKGRERPLQLLHCEDQQVGSGDSKESI